MRNQLRVCSTPGCPALQAAPRCPTHQRERDQHQRHTTPTKMTRDADRRRRSAFVDAHRAANGNWCPGYQRPPHTSTDLTADHIHDIALGGDPHGPLQVLCRSCNSRKAGQSRAAHTG